MFPFFRRRRTSRSTPRYYRPELLQLEERTLLSATLIVDASHTLQSALQQANPVGGDTIKIEAGASISTLSQSGGAVALAANAGATTLTVSKYISPAEIINVGSGATADDNVLVDADTRNGSNYVLTLHTALTNAHAVGDAVTPVANTIGVGVPVTIEGDPANPAFAFPAGFSLELFKASSSTAAVTLQNLALSLSQGGTAISGATAGDLNLQQDQIAVTGASSSAIAVNAAGALTVSGSRISVTGSSSYGINSTIGGDENLTSSIVYVSGDSSSANTSHVTGALNIAGSTLTLAGNTGAVEGSTVTGPISVSNSFLTLKGDSGSVLGDTSGGSYTITGNSITVTGSGGSAGNDFGVNAQGAGAFLLEGNSIVMTDNPGTDVSWQLTSGSSQENILNNTLATAGRGTGLLLNQLQNSPGPVLVQGNDFQNNKIGVQIVGNGTSAGTVDLGGGSLHSLGGNDFRGYPASGAGGAFAISLSKTNSSASVSAQANIWDLDSSGNVIDPHSVIQDGGNNTGASGAGTIDVGAVQLSADQEYVQTLYRVLLGRVGTLTQVEVDGWASAVSTQGATAIAQRIVNDVGHEAYMHLVETYYQQFLGRAASLDEVNTWVNQFLDGATEEQVIAGIVTSPEFAQKNLFLASSSDSNSGFVQALYSGLLHRDTTEGTLTQADIKAASSKLAQMGRTGLVMDFLSGSDFTTADSSTFRQAAVRSFYGDPTLAPVPFQPFLPDLLNRTTVLSSEVSGWVDSGLDLLSMEISILDDRGLEFFHRG